ncbi:MAG TPA: hypothetical protein VF590_16845, partial [Isosphaeraceae bacterium]
VGGGVLSFYTSTEGIEAATLLAFTFGEGASGGGSGVPPAIFPGPGSGPSGTPAPGGTQQVAQLVPLRESALALVATLLTVSLDASAIGATTATPPEGVGTPATFSTTATTAPNQAASRDEDQDDAPAEAEAEAEEPPADEDPVPQPDKLPDWIRFLAGLNEELDRQGRAFPEDLPGGAGTPSLAARVLTALDVALGRLIPRPDADRTGLTGRLRQAVRPVARTVGAMIDLLVSADVPVTPPIPPPAFLPSGAGRLGAAGPERGQEAVTEDTSAGTVPLVIVAALLARRPWTGRRRRAHPARTATTRGGAMRGRTPHRRG